MQIVTNMGGETMSFFSDAFLFRTHSHSKLKSDIKSTDCLSTLLHYILREILYIFRTVFIENVGTAFHH